MKTTFFVFIGILVMCVNLYAAGDLVVNGQLTVGPTPDASRKLYVDSIDKKIGLYVNVQNQDTGLYYGARYNVLAGGTSGSSNGYGLDMNATLLTNGASVGTFTGGNYEIRVGATSSTAIDSLFANKVRLSILGTGVDHAATNVAGIYYDISRYGSTGKIAAQTYRGLYLSDNSVMFNGSTHSQIWIDKITGGTTNRGIVLNGDGAGADIVFGPTQNARIFSENGYLKAQDVRGNITQFSPHDPETGEWIFYSKNVKTGKTVRVNMEQLVRAVEKLTGEKFMIEKIEEIE